MQSKHRFIKAKKTTQKKCGSINPTKLDLFSHKLKCKSNFFFRLKKKKKKKSGTEFTSHDVLHGTGYTEHVGRRQCQYRWSRKCTCTSRRWVKRNSRGNQWFPMVVLFAVFFYLVCVWLWWPLFKKDWANAPTETKCNTPKVQKCQKSIKFIHCLFCYTCTLFYISC